VISAPLVHVGVADRRLDSQVHALVLISWRT
jgi:hypothetical protein